MDVLICLSNATLALFGLGGIKLSILLFFGNITRMSYGITSKFCDIY